MKVVLDTNVLVSVFLFKGKLASLFEFIDSGKVIPCFTQPTISELREVLKRERFQKELFNLDLSAETIIDALLEKSEIYPLPKKKSLLSRDPADNKFIDCALVSGAHYLVSGDKDLLVLKRVQDVPIITPAQFLKETK